MPTNKYIAFAFLLLTPLSGLGEHKSGPGRLASNTATELETTHSAYGENAPMKTEKVLSAAETAGPMTNRTLPKMPKGAAMRSPILLKARSGNKTHCGNWENVVAGNHTTACKFRFQLTLDAGSYYEPWRGTGDPGFPEGKSTWNWDVSVPAPNTWPAGLSIGHYGGGGGLYPAARNPQTNRFGIQPVDTKKNLTSTECTGSKGFQAYWLGYGWFPAGSWTGLAKEQKAEKYVQRRIAYSLFWLKGQFGDALSFNDITSSGTSMGHQGAHNFNMTNPKEPWAGLLSYSGGKVGSWYYRGRGTGEGEESTPCKRGPDGKRNEVYTGANTQYWNETDPMWHIENSPAYRDSWCGAHSFGYTDSFRYTTIRPLLQKYIDRGMCQVFYLGGGYQNSMKKTKHSDADGCFKWPGSPVTDKNMKFTRNHPALSFTNSTANNPQNNHWGPELTRGHYNLGLTWNSKDIKESSRSLEIPIRYKATIFKTRNPPAFAETEESCAWVNGKQTVMPNQPTNLRVDITLYRPTVTPSLHPNFKGKFWPKPGQRIKVTYGTHIDIQRADKDGKVTFPSVPMSSGKTYQAIIFQKLETAH